MDNKIYWIVLLTSFCLAFTQGKPCCKSNKGKASCKLNQTNIDISDENDKINKHQLSIDEKSNFQSVNFTNQNIYEQKTCAKAKNKPWWKFWSKKNSCCSKI